MALGDYILCSKCECKLVYDGRRDGRDWLEERFQTRSLMCPDCLAALKAERDALRAALEHAKNGLLWYQDRYPEASDGSDDEAMERINAALAKEPT